MSTLTRRSAPLKGVLIVDDKPEIRGHIRTLLVWAGIEAEDAESSRDAKLKIAANGLGIVIVNVHMADLGGESLAIWIRKNHPYLHVIFLTEDPPAKGVEYPINFKHHDCPLVSLSDVTANSRFLVDMVWSRLKFMATDHRLESIDDHLEKAHGKVDILQEQLLSVHALVQGLAIRLDQHLTQEAKRGELRDDETLRVKTTVQALDEKISRRLPARSSAGAWKLEWFLSLITFTLVCLVGMAGLKFRDEVRETFRLIQVDQNEDRRTINTQLQTILEKIEHKNP